MPRLDDDEISEWLGRLDQQVQLLRNETAGLRITMASLATGERDTLMDLRAAIHGLSQMAEALSLKAQRLATVKARPVMIDWRLSPQRQATRARRQH